MIPVFDSFFQALAKGFQIWDFYNKTRYARQYQDIYKSLYEEMAKPVYPPEDGKTYHYSMLRDQAKIDELQLDMAILIKQFLKEKPNYESDISAKS